MDDMIPILVGLMLLELPGILAFLPDFDPIILFFFFFSLSFLLHDLNFLIRSSLSSSSFS